VQAQKKKRREKQTEKDNSPFVDAVICKMLRMEMISIMGL